ncbi:hypothetical protein CDEN61S_03929 [Castellaniella denitrificans]
MRARALTRLCACFALVALALNEVDEGLQVGRFARLALDAFHRLLVDVGRIADDTGRSGGPARHLGQQVAAQRLDAVPQAVQFDVGLRDRQGVGGHVHRVHGRVAEGVGRQDRQAPRAGAQGVRHPYPGGQEGQAADRPGDVVVQTVAVQDRRQPGLQSFGRAGGRSENCRSIIATPGMTLPAPVPACRFDLEGGGRRKYSLPCSSSGPPASSARAGASSVIRLRARCG